MCSRMNCCASAVGFSCATSTAKVQLAHAFDRNLVGQLRERLDDIWRTFGERATREHDRVIRRNGRPIVLEHH